MKEGRIPTGIHAVRAIHGSFRRSSAALLWRLCLGLRFWIVWMMAAIWKHYRWVAVAQTPYFIWVSIAMALQLNVAWSNW